MAEYAKEQSEEQRRIAQAIEHELTGKSQAMRELEEEFGREKEQWETIRMRTELDGLRQLEDIRQQFDCERERHRRELEQQASVIEKLKQELAAEREKTSRFAVVPPGAGTSSETIASLHVHEGSAAFAGSGASVPEGSAIVNTGSGALDSVLVHDGLAAVVGLTVN